MTNDNGAKVFENLKAKGVFENIIVKDISMNAHRQMGATAMEPMRADACTTALRGGWKGSNKCYDDILEAPSSDDK
jgi:hypothetical protein